MGVEIRRRGQYAPLQDARFPRWMRGSVIDPVFADKGEVRVVPVCGLKSGPGSGLHGRKRQGTVMKQRLRC